MLSRLQLPLSEVASREGAAVTIHSVGEVLASDADLSPLPALELSVVDELPFLHKHLTWYACTTTSGTAFGKERRVKANDIQ